jgi:hypothetical protein
MTPDDGGSLGAIKRLLRRDWIVEAPESAEHVEDERLKYWGGSALFR